MKVPLQLRYRHPPPCTNLDRRRELARPAESVEGVGVQTESAGRIRYGDQVSDGNLVVHTPGDEGHAAPLALLGHPTGKNVPPPTLG